MDGKQPRIPYIIKNAQRFESVAKLRTFPDASATFRYVREYLDGKKIEAEAVAREYVHHMLQKSREYAALADRPFNRAVPQILLLHMNFINSMILDELLEKFAVEGWSFTTLAKANPIYALADPYVGPRVYPGSSASSPADNPIYSECRRIPVKPW